jgi:tripartite-type tricarboxylate transporter receptor subunit TctC
MSGEADIMIVDGAPLLPAIKSGRVRALAITGAQRNPAFPDIPTFAEAGFPKYQEVSYFGAYLPAGTPAPIIAKLHDALTSETDLPDVVSRLNTLGWSPVKKGQKEFDDYYRSEIAKWKSIVKAAKIPAMD